MKRDMDLCRRILKAIEAFAEDGEPQDGARDWTDVEAERGFSLTACLHHVWLLQEAGLLHGIEVQAGGQFLPLGSARCLTWAGHEFLAAAENETRWNEAKKYASEKAAGLSLQVLTATLRHFAGQALGFPV